MKTLLIADSGGTRTDWCFVNEQGQRHFFESESYHPTNWNAHFWARIKKFWEDHPLMLNAELHFFGAGCLNESNASLIKNQFGEIGFKQSLIKSDVHAAGIALFGKESGYGAILGTGSVAFEWSGGELNKVVGGKGYKKGDEGSGYYFGKLVFIALEAGELTEKQQQIFLSVLNQKEIRSELGKDDEKKSLAEIAIQLHPHREEFKIFHEENIQAFYKCHLLNTNYKSIRMVGGYALHYQKWIVSCLLDHGVKIEKVEERPIVSLVEQIAPTVD